MSQLPLPHHPSTSSTDQEAAKQKKRKSDSLTLLRLIDDHQHGGYQAFHQ
jgi:hypothetical protein